MNRTGNIFLGLCAALLLAAGAGRAETVFWSDSFETNVPGRWTTSSTWRIGSPTAGPAVNTNGFRTHSGTNCASTQNYAYNDSRLICTNYNGAGSFVVPPANQFPRLRFWHWFNFANALGFVEISTNNGSSWNQISPTTYPPNLSSPLDATSGGVWSRPSIDLSAYAGQSVQIAFRFAGLCCGNGLGWYVDDVAVVTNTPVFNNPESFESGAGDWSVDLGTWEIGRPTSGPGQGHLGSTNCAATVLAGDYPYNVDSRLISPPFAVPSNNPALRFWHWYDFNNAFGFVEISTDGSSWNQLSPNYYQNGNTGGAWTNVSLDLSAYAGQTVQVAFRFASGGFTAAGWYVDDISLVASPTLTVPPTQTIFSGQTLVVTNYATLLPANGMPRFELVSGPANLDVSNLATNGVLTWTTTIAQAPSTNTITIKVTETDVPALSNTPALSATNSFMVVVLNPWTPVLTVPPTQTIFAGQTLVVTNYATNNFFPDDTFTFGTNSAPAGVSINPTSGVLRWATTTAQPAGTYTNVITVVDGVSLLSATNSFVVVVSNPPLPVLTVPGTQAIYAGQKLVVTNSATNSAFPHCTFTFGTNSAPAGVSINPTNGVLTWTPTAAQAPNIYSISVKVTDNNSPPLGATNGFLVLVSPTPPPVLTVPTAQTLKINGFQFTLNTAPNITWRIDASTNILANTTNWLRLLTNTAGPGGTIQFTDLLATNYLRRFYRAVLP